MKIEVNTLVKNKNKEESLFPSIQLITESKLIDVIVEKVCEKLSEHQHA